MVGRSGVKPARMDCGGMAGKKTIYPASKKDPLVTCSVLQLDP